MESKRYTVAIDLGESNVVVIVGESSAQSSNAPIAIVCVVSRPCQGVKVGMIENIALVEEAIKEAIGECEDKLGCRILEVYAGISGEFVRFACHSDHVYIKDGVNGVSKRDVEALFERMRHVQAPDNESIMMRIPQNYVVDDSKELKNPVGSFGRRLSSTFNFILCATTPMQRLENALRRLDIKLIKAFPNALSAGESVLSEEEREEGVALVNIGGGITDVTIYARNVVRYMVSIPMGAAAINSDIRSMMIPEKSIEKLKREHGSAVADLVPENRALKVNGRTAKEYKYIPLYNLAVVIESRMAMLIEFINREIVEAGYKGKLPYGIVLTGGGAKLKNIEVLFSRMTDMEIRIGTPVESLCAESIEMVDSPEYATAVGLLINGCQSGSCATQSAATTSTPTPEPTPAPEVEVVVEKPKTPINKNIQDEQNELPKAYSPSEPYTPPTRRPYTPPKPHAQRATTKEELEAEMLERGIMPQKGVTPQSENETITAPAAEVQTSHDEPKGIIDIMTDRAQEELQPQQEQREEQEQRETTTIPKAKERRWGNIFKNTIEKISSSFDAAGDDEI